jgi:arylsulfatase A-like enzyme
VIEDFINVRDFAPTFLAAAGVKPPETITGTSFLGVLTSGKSGVVDPNRSVMLIGKERHDLGRPYNHGYPVRAIRTAEYLYVRNCEPDRWPAGNPETGYRNVDDGPTKRAILSSFDDHYRLSFGKRPAEELYLVKSDPDCMRNLAADLAHAVKKRELRDKMDEMLREQGDPRALGNASFFDAIDYVGPHGHSYDTWLRHNKP